MPSLPTVTSDIPRDLRQFLDRVRENINGRGEDELVTVRKLVAAGIAEYTGGTLSSSTDGTYYPTPPAPTGVAANGALANIIVTWDKAVYNGHAYTEIWSAQQTTAQANADPEEFPDLGEAILVGMAPGEIWVDNIGGGGSRWYWLRYVNVEGQVGPYNAVDGTRGDTATDPAHLIELLNGQISASELASSLSSRIDLIDGPATTVGTVAYKLADIQGQVNELLNLPEWSSTETYAIDDQIVYEGFLYVAVAASTNVEPGTDDTKWEQIGEYATIGDAVAAHTTQIATLDNDLGQEVTDRTTLATQLRGSYDGNDLSLVSQGLIFEERTARSQEDAALAQSIQTLSAFANTKSRVFYQDYTPVGTTDNPLTVGDLWIDTDVTYADDYVEGDYVIRSNRMYRWDGTDWVEAMDFGFADWFSAIRTEKTARVDEDEALATSITQLTTATNNSLATINQTLTTHTTDISTNASAITSLGVELRGADSTLSSAIQTEANARATADQTNAQAITTLQSTVNGNTAAIQTEAETRAEETGDLFAQYTVKVDVNGYVSGFGLASTEVDGTPFSEFIVNANSFAVGQPGETEVYPFIVRTTETTINGETVPAGVYMQDAFIQNGTITNAKIGNAAIDDAKIANLSAEKITSGYIDAARIQAGSLTADMIDTRGLTIKDSEGNVIFGSGLTIPVSYISGLGSLAGFNEITVGDLTDAGALAALDEVSEENLESGLAGTIDGKIESWFQSSDPAHNWDSDLIRAKHLGDMWWDTSANKLYRYTYGDHDDDGTTPSTYYWNELTDQVATDAYANAAAAQDTADGKRRVFVAQPVPPYDEGDLWDRGSTTGIWRCATPKATGETYAGTDWQVVADLTGNNTAAAISNQGSLATLSEVSYDYLEQDLAGYLDGKIEQHYGTSDPSTQWGTQAQKDMHIGDLWYKTDEQHLYVWRSGDDPDTESETETHFWKRVENQTAIDAAAAASTAQDTADAKRRVFVAEPEPPYDVGDLWDRGAVTGIWRCVTEKGTDGEYAIDDWTVVADATGSNTAASIVNQGSLATLSEVSYTELESDLAGLIDGKVEQHYGTSDPQTQWADADKALHLGDLWYHTTDKLLYIYTAGDDPATQGTEEDYYWAVIENQAAIDAAAAASNAQDTADGKRRVFVAEPTVPYDVGDLWDRGATLGIWRANKTKASNGAFDADDWQVIADATGSNVAASVVNQGPFATLDQITADNISTYIAGAAITNAYIGNTIQSATYKSASESGGPAGWKIDKQGGMEMKDATFYGTLDIDEGSGSRLVIKSDRIEVWEGTTLRVRLGNLNP